MKNNHNDYDKLLPLSQTVATELIDFNSNQCRRHYTTSHIITDHSSSEKPFLVLGIKCQRLVTGTAGVAVLGEFEVAHGNIEMSGQQQCAPLVSFSILQRLLALQVVNNPLVVAHRYLVLARLHNKCINPSAIKKYLCDKIARAANPVKPKKGDSMVQK